ncbi:monovalent cation/H+ antiporter complex subunit F [Streptomyces sp. ME19-01-6]|uniref:monovalent cation/H+ antiporter complex subunit F n=1 Tax=Streptomyces sp. ME19-01-6 TaxID=3028686 RepID=UPI0029BD3B47|nr:monovalent cation/H+ antiporter complex subunit F [Streptomyces sp. ME19-01-6]MDX3229096.1 monovalent cation/H+ antiporter complex subunit F [Streptomyces sp. ME19-01-6]
MSAADGWLLAGLVPLLGLVPVLWRIACGEPRDRLIAQNLACLLAALALLLTAQGFGRPAYVDVALVLAVLGPTGTLIYARFLGVLPGSPVVRWTALAGAPAVVLPLCVATGPGRAAVKLLLIGALLIAGSLVTSAGSRSEGGRA